MDFDLSEEQELLRSSIEKYLIENYDFDARRRIIRNSEHFPYGIWKDAAELGWLGIPFSEELDGFGGGPIETMLMFEEFGKVLCVEPFLESLIVGGGILKRLPANDSITEKLAAVISGDQHIVLAHEEADTTLDDTDLTTRAVAEDLGFSLNGTKSVVSTADFANELIVSATLNDGALGLFLVDSNAPGLTMTSYPTIDGRSASDIQFCGVQVPESALIAEAQQAEKLLGDTFQEALLALSAEQVGIMRALMAQTVEYTKQRQQFGTSISKFQVLQHRMADMYMALELTVSLMYTAAIRLRDQSPEAEQLVRALKIKADRSARFVAHGAFQLHGAIATTDECAIGHYLKRSTAIAQELGGTEYQLHRYVEFENGSIEQQFAG